MHTKKITLLREIKGTPSIDVKKVSTDKTVRADTEVHSDRKSLTVSVDNPGYYKVTIKDFNGDISYRVLISETWNTGSIGYHLGGSGTSTQVFSNGDGTLTARTGEH